jgi:hypothetical protein
MPSPDFADAHPGYVSLSALRLPLCFREQIVAFVNKNSGAGAPRARFAIARPGKRARRRTFRFAQSTLPNGIFLDILNA